MRADPRPHLRAIVLLALLCVPLSACVQAGGKSNPKPISFQNEMERQNEALRLIDRAQKAAKKDKNQEAIDLFGQALAAYDGFAGAWNNLGVLLLDQRNYQGAIVAFNRAAELNPGDPRPMTNIGIAYARAGHADKALRAFEDALERDPNWLDAIRGAAKSTSLLMIADEHALARVKHALLIEPDDKWRSLFESEQYRIEKRIAAREP